ncbi:MAG: glycosyltransferase [Parvibaculum sp.]|uniref:glycosyltransferase n=1 Tax=Parvibaculum sp. TaxID=2024848 RepID=UPI0025F89282|nr:glycosyltransferase [Parvibaculum sp.]MCE9650953.1 glycosyltransferase [Parvibaculum sp.]
MKALAAAPEDSALFVTQYYRPEWIGSGPYCGDMAEWLTTHELDVRVLTGRPHYPGDAIFADYRSGARDAEVLEGVSITRVPNRVANGGGALRRMLTDAHFLLRSLFELARGRVRRQRLVVSLCPSILTVILGAIMTQRGGRHVAVIHDIESGLAEGLGMVGGGALLRCLRAVERIALNRTDLVLVLSENMREQLVSRKVRTPIKVLPIWIDTDAIFPTEKRAPQPMTVVYSGNFGKKQSLAQILDLASLLQTARPAIRIVLRGDGREARMLGETAQSLGLRNIEFRPLLPPARLNEALAEGDIHLVPQNPQAADYAVPSKIFAIMASGRPFIATAEPGSLLWRMREETDAFLCVPPNDPAAFADAVLRLAENDTLRAELGARGRAYALAHHAKPKVLRDFMSAVRGAA